MWYCVRRAEHNRRLLIVVQIQIFRLLLNRCGNINMLQTMLKQAATVNSQKNSAQPQLSLLVAQAQCGVYICSPPVSLTSWVSLSPTPILMPEPQFQGTTMAPMGAHHKARQGWLRLERLNVTPNSKPRATHALWAIYLPRQISGLTTSRLRLKPGTLQ
jgi:hypothetical protein